MSNRMLRIYIKLQRLLARWGLKLPGKIMYIGGSDTLPPPLSRDEEAELIARLDAAAAEGKEKGVKGLPAKLGMEMAAEMIAKIRDGHICPGVHIMAIGAERNVPPILEMAGVQVEF